MTETGSVEPTTSSKRVHLLMPTSEDRRLLERWLDQQFSVTVGETAASLDRAFDLCIVDETTFARHTDALVDRKARDSPTFLPYVLVLGDHTPDTVDPRVWEHIDDLVSVPIDKPSLQGRLSGLLVRRDLSSALSQREERIRSILETIPEPLLIVDDSETIVASNPALADRTGVDPGSIDGSPLAAFEPLPSEAVSVMTRLAAMAHESVAESASDGATTGGREAIRPVEGSTITYLSGDGAVRHAEIGVAAIRGSPAARQQTLFVLRDVTERLEREQTLQRERDRLDEFADMLAHEIRNPLNIAQGFLGEISPDTADEADSLERISAAHRRMAQMIKELLVHARGELTGDKRPVDLAKLARIAWSQTPTGDGTLEFAGEAVTLEAAPEQLQTLLTNLFRNAIEHAGLAATVRVGPLPEGGFYVEDNGQGIPPSEREAVFDRGYTTNAAGTGLGLALVREVAAANDWTVSVGESRDGGARFEFRDRVVTDIPDRNDDRTDDRPPG